MRARQADSFSPTLIAEGYLKESRRKQARDKRLGFLLAAAHTAWNELEEEKPSDQARKIYNAATTELVALLGKAPWNATTAIEAPTGSYRVRFANGNRKLGIWDPSFFKEIVVFRAVKEKSLIAVVSPEGFGGVLVGAHKPEDPRKWLLPRIGVSAPVTAIADFKGTPSHPTVDVTLTLYDPTKRERVPLAQKTRPLTADFGAPLAHYPNPRLLEYAALIDPVRYEKREGLYLIQPYDPDKIPVVLVHGLMSIPQMWFPVIAQIEGDPECGASSSFGHLRIRLENPSRCRPWACARAFGKLTKSTRRPRTW
jgi:hypothetical protein